LAVTGSHAKQPVLRQNRAASVMPRIVAASMAAQTLAANRLVPSIFHPFRPGPGLTARVLYHPGHPVYAECHSIFNLVRWEYRTSFVVDSGRLGGMAELDI
jgi:hypothetical protein